MPDSLEALRAWADAATARASRDEGRGTCDLVTLNGQLHGADGQWHQDLSEGFLRWRHVLVAGLGDKQERGALAPAADVSELAYALLAALQGGSLLAQTLADVQPLRASLDAALAYVSSFAL